MTPPTFCDSQFPVLASESGTYTMPKLHVSVPHQLSQEDALKRVQKAIASAKDQNSDKIRGLQESWDGFTGTFSGKAMGYSAKGTLTVNPKDVVVESDLPLFASPFKSKLEAAITDMLTRLLA
jgi:Putative polyhydroxyalkanoic acid system protein (PHA_gran_rgn)